MASDIYGIPVTSDGKISMEFLASLTIQQKDEVLLKAAEQSAQEPRQAHNQNSLLLEAVLQSHAEAKSPLSENERALVCELVKHGVEKHRAKWISLAADSGDEQIFEMLCRHFITEWDEADPKELSPYFAYAMDFAEDCSNLSEMDYIYEEYSQTPERCTRALYHALWRGNRLAVRYLLNDGADYEVIDRSILVGLLESAQQADFEEEREKALDTLAALMELAPERMEELLDSDYEEENEDDEEDADADWGDLIDGFAMLGIPFVSQLFAFLQDAPDKLNEAACYIVESLVSEAVYSDDLEVDVEPILEYVLKNGARITDEVDRRLRLLADDMPKTILRLLEQYTQK